MSKKYIDTRDKILKEAFKEFQKNGYKRANIDTIVKKAGVTKGALYYYFKSKKELANCVIDTIITVQVKEKFLKYFTPGDKYSIQESLMMFADSMSIKEITSGSTLLKLAHEMSDNQYGTQDKIKNIIDKMNKSIADKLTIDQHENKLPMKYDATQVAQLISTMILGAFALAKIFHDSSVLRCSIEQFNNVLDIVYEK